MTRRSLLSALFLLASGIFIYAGDARILKMTLDDTINPITEEYIARGIDRAAKDHDEAILIEMDTPGGLVTSTRGIVNKILSSPVPVIVYIGPSGARAGSAGFYILESADVAAMAPGTNAGAAHPVLMGEKMDPVMKEKLENDSAAFMRSFVSKRGRNVELAESGVRQSKSFTDQECLQQHLIDYDAKSDKDLLQQLDGKSLKRFDGNEVSLHVANAEIDDFQMTVREHVLDFLMDPNIAFILLVLGALAIYVEFHTPGAMVPGAIGIVAVLLAIFALYLLPTSLTGVGLITLAFILFILEAKFQSHGLLTVPGTILLVLGALMLVDGPIPQMRVHLSTALAVSIPFAFITSALMTIAIRARRNKVQTGREELIGQLAVVRAPLAPEGTVFVLGETWSAISEKPVSPGERVRVRAVHGLKLEVEPVAKKS